jgi:NAD(P)-dependent dehydrogenase (short-subunit alcohol dehydrogenase family)
LTEGKLQDRVALVTGAAQGIGAAVARGLAAQGARILVTDVNGPGAEGTAERIVADHGAGRAFAAALDVTREDDWKAAVTGCRERFGSLSILVNNAGIITLGSVIDLDLADWRRSMAINVDGPFLGCKHALPLMGENQPGSIINIASISAMVAAHNLAAYNASKAALWMLTKSVALDCARRGWAIRCNSIHPTFVRTALLDGFVGDRDRDVVFDKLARQVPNGRIAEVEDVVNAVSFLASDDSAMMTASEIKLDGGLSAQ